MVKVEIAQHQGGKEQIIKQVRGGERAGRSMVRKQVIGLVILSQVKENSKNPPGANRSIDISSKGGEGTRRMEALPIRWGWM